MTRTRPTVTLTTATLATALLALAPTASAQTADADRFGTLADRPALQGGLRELRPLPVEPQFADPGTDVFAASLLDLGTEGAANVLVLRPDSREGRMPLPEEPRQ
jgi:hypothetical protein